MIILEVYDRYQILPTLQQHQLRVASVAQLLCQHLDADTDNIVLACLLHDMGNIIKFDLAKPSFPKFLEPQGQTYWQSVQQKFINQYGPNEHQASLTIAQELGVGERVVELIECVNFDNIQHNYQTDDLGKKICDYSDMRVTPHGITDLESRLVDLNQRYEQIYPSQHDQEQRRQFQFFTREIEKQLFENIDLKPSDITRQTVSHIIKQLKNFQL